MSSFINLPNIVSLAMQKILPTKYNNTVQINDYLMQRNAGINGETMRHEGQDLIIKTNNVDVCKQMCDRFDDCSGFTHDQIDNSCSFYTEIKNSGKNINDTYHFGHMAAFLKKSSTMPKKEFIPFAVNRIENSILLVNESLAKKSKFNYKIKGRVWSDAARKLYADTDYCPDDYRCETGDYQINNYRIDNYRTDAPSMNVQMKNAMPELNYSSVQQINADIISLNDALESLTLDYEHALTANDTLIAAYDYLPGSVSADYTEQILELKNKLEICNEQIIYLLSVLEEYKYFVLLRRILHELNKEIISPANDTIQTAQAIIKNFGILPDSSLRAMMDRLDDSYDKVLIVLSKIAKVQKTILFKYDLMAIPIPDRKFLIKFNNRIVEMIYSAVEIYNYVHMVCSIKNKRTNIIKNFNLDFDSVMDTGYVELNPKTLKYQGNRHNETGNTNDYGNNDRNNYGNTDGNNVCFSWEKSLQLPATMNAKNKKYNKIVRKYHGNFIAV